MSSSCCTDDAPEAKAAEALPKLLLLGQPNVGKSVLFHALTGRYATVSNFPGTTVETLRGRATLGARVWEVFDTPGVVTLPPRTDDERVARDAILELGPKAIIQVADAKDLARTLHLTLELGEYGVPMVLALNMADEMRDRGIRIDTARLSAILGIPVVETIAVTREGLSELKKAVERAAVPKLSPRYDGTVEKTLKSLEGPVTGPHKPARRAIAASLFLKDESAERFSPDAAVHAAAAQARSCFVRAPELLRFEAKQSVIQWVVAETLATRGANRGGWLATIGRLSVRPFPGYLFAAGALFLLYQFVGVFGAQTLVGFFEETLFGKYFNPFVIRVFETLVPLRIVRDLFVGEYGMITMAVTYALALILPIVSTFFIFFGILEDSGYLPRLAVMLDRFFRLIGLNGKAVLPMVLGLGCGTMATVTTRILGTKKEKILVSLLLTLAVPCSAQLGVILGMTAGASPKVFFVWLAVIGASLMLVGWVAARLLPGGQPAFLLELPPLRVPQASNVLKKVSSRLKWYTVEVVPLFCAATAMLFVLNELKLLERIEQWMSPVVVGFLGLPAKASESFLIGFLRRDYGAAGFFQLSKDGLLDTRQLIVSMSLITLFMPCVAHFLVTLKERGTKVTLLIFLFVLSYALAVGGALNALLLWKPVI